MTPRDAIPGMERSLSNGDNDDQKVHTSPTQLQATLNVIPAYAWYASSCGGLTFVNKRTADYLGLPEDHPLRFGIDTNVPWDAHIRFLHPDDHDETRKVWPTCLRTGEAGEVSFRARDVHGGYRWFLSRAEPLRASDGTILQWVRQRIGSCRSGLKHAARLSDCCDDLEAFQIEEGAHGGSLLSRIHLEYKFASERAKILPNLCLLVNSLLCP